MGDPDKKYRDELNSLLDTPHPTKEGKRRLADLTEYFKSAQVNHDQISSDVDSLPENVGPINDDRKMPSIMNTNLSVLGTTVASNIARGKVTGKGGKRTKKRKTKKSKRSKLSLSKRRKTHRRK